ncbi:MAG: type II toxin-antitoxin system mRNA interferase toxin, RelE/StbE family [Minisyncoccia bacterium]
MISLIYTHTFIKQLKKLDNKFYEEVLEKIKLFENPLNHKRLKVHKLHGRLSDKYAFWINRKDRIIFQYGLKNEVYLLAIDDHDGYR